MSAPEMPAPCDQVLQAASDIGPVLRRDAEVAEQNSRLTDEAAGALRDAGLFRLGVPRRFGGYEADLASGLQVISEVARACPASAWIVAISYGAQHAAESYGQQVCEELWADDPDKAFCGAFSPETASLRTTEDGIVVSGRWPWASGCHHASWACLGVPPAADGADSPGLALVPIDRLSIDNTWNMAGMRGTGSDTLVADEVHVPHR